MVKVTALLMLSLLTALFGMGDQSKQPDASANENGRKWEAKLEKYVKLTITPIEYSRKANDYVPTTQFKVGTLMRVMLTMTNTSDEPLGVARFGQYVHNRLRLVKDGKPVRYLNGVAEGIKGADENEGIFISPREGVLGPNSEGRYTQLDLSDWYGQLQPGHYELTIRHRFNWRGKWIESNTVEFDVVP